MNGFRVGGEAACPPAGVAGASGACCSTAFSCLRFTKLVNSLGPSGTSSMGGASAPALRMLVVLEIGRFRNVSFDSGADRGEGVESSASRAGIGDAGEGTGAGTGVRGAAGAEAMAGPVNVG